MIIRRANGIGSAGQAADAFNRTTAATNASRIRVEESLRRQRDRQIQFDAIQAQRADVESARREEADRALDIRAKQVENQGLDRVRRQLGRFAPGELNGQSMIRMATRISELDRAAYQQMDQEFDAITGGQFIQDEVTPEALDALPNKAEVYGLLGRYLKPLEEAADVRAIESGFQDLTQNVQAMGSEWLQTAEGVNWQAGLQADLARAQRSGSGFTGAQARALYAEHQAQAAAAIQIHGQRQTYANKYQSRLQELGKVDNDDLKAASLIMAGMGTSRDPHTTYVKAMMRIDPELRKAGQLGAEDGVKRGVLGATAAQVQREQAAAPRGTDHDAEMAARANMPAAATADDPAARALGLGNDERQQLREEIKAEGGELTEENVRAFIRKKLSREKLQGIYNQEAGQGRFVN